MPDQSTLLQLADERLCALSTWIDEHNAHRDAEARTWGRIAKLTEETGEVISEYIGVTGQNPRKGTSGEHVLAVADELYDVAITALGAIAHLHRNRPEAEVVATLLERIADVHTRAGLPEIRAPKVDRPQAAHRVTWDMGLPRWYCDGDALSSCHWYPDCDCEVWGENHRHPTTPHADCWVLTWLENTWSSSYLDAEGEVVELEHLIPQKDGLITWEFEEDFVLWSYA